jgi:hypothetical protein
MIRRVIKPTEHVLQTRLLNILAYTARPDTYHFAIPNAGQRSYHVAAKMKAEGLRSGVSDLCFMLPADEGYVGWLEMKKHDGSLSIAQHGFRAICERLGHRWAMARSVEEAFDIVGGWGVLKPGAVIL